MQQYGAPWGQKTAARAWEEVEHATHHGPRAQQTPPPGERPGILAEPKRPQLAALLMGRRPDPPGWGVGRGSGRLCSQTGWRPFVFHACCTFYG